jgi:hypothetical protein
LSVRVGDVEVQVRRLAARCLDRAHRVAAGVVDDVAQQHLRALCRQTLRDRAADAHRSAGDQR